MKKILLTAVAILALTTANAQEKEVSTYKPNAGDVTAEFILNGGILNSDFNFTNGGIRGRYFLDAKSALRGSILVNSSSETTPAPEAPGVKEGESVVSTTSFNLGFGYEKHFSGTKRLSPYVGAELGLGFTSGKTTDSSATLDDAKNTQISSIVKEAGNFGVTLSGVFGADYYFVENVYLGVEAGLGINFNSVGTAETTVNDGTTTTTTEVEGGSSFGISPFIGGVKIGFVF